MKPNRLCGLGLLPQAQSPRLQFHASAPGKEQTDPGCRRAASYFTAAELCQLRISRVDLRRLFAEAAKLLLGIKRRDQARLVATRAYWEVHIDSHHETAALEA